MWIIHSLAYPLYLMTQSEFAKRLPPNMADRLKMICLNRTRPESAPRVTIGERLVQLRDHHGNFMEYAGEDAIALWGILRGEATTVNINEDLVAGKRNVERHWFGQDFFLIALRIAQQEMQMPIWMCRKIMLDDRIRITEEQHTQIRRLADGVWRDFRSQCKTIAALKHTTVLTAMVSTSPNHICWDLILGISKEIAEMIRGEMAVVIGIGVFMFGLKRLEMWREAVYYLMVGTHRGSRSLAL